DRRRRTRHQRGLVLDGRDAALKPAAQNTTRRSGNVDKPHAHTTRGVLPDNFSREPDQSGVAGQGELEVDPAVRRKLAFALDRGALLAEIDEGGGSILDVGVVEGNLRVGGDPASPPALARHEGVRGTKAAGSAFF